MRLWFFIKPSFPYSRKSFLLSGILQLPFIPLTKLFFSASSNCCYQFMAWLRTLLFLIYACHVLCCVRPIACSPRESPICIATLAHNDPWEPKSTQYGAFIVFLHFFWVPQRSVHILQRWLCIWYLLGICLIETATKPSSFQNEQLSHDTNFHVNQTGRLVWHNWSHFYVLITAMEISSQLKLL